VEILEEYESDFQERNGRPISAATINRLQSMLSVLFKWAILKRLADSNPALGLPRRREDNARRRTYTDEEFVALLEAADDLADTTNKPIQQFLPMFLRLAWETGARCGELLRLRWVDITWLDGELGAELELLDTKNHTDREIYISRDTATLLRAHQQQSRSDLVFPPAQRGEQVKIHRPFRVALEHAGLEKPDARYGEVLTLHHLRHSYATRLGDNGASLAQLMAAGGWKTPSMAVRYMKVRKSQAAEAALLLMGK
jgi:integrase